MSTGRLIGGILGAGLGYVIGGGALMPVMYGLSLGWTVGAMFDKPDSKPPGRPPVAELSVTTAREGALIYDLLGTHKFTGNIIGYWNSRSVEVTSEVSSGEKGGGGSQTVVEGYQYYLTWAMGICLGPVDKLFTVWRGEECVWDGELSRPSSGGESTITLCGMGSMTLYWGTSDHSANATIAGLVNDNTINPPYRHLCWAFFNDCMIGDYNRLPTMHFVVMKSPTLDFNVNNVIETYDYNPAHAIYYILNKMVGLNFAYLDSTSFSTSADALYLESRGISILFDTNQEALEYIQSVLSHIDAVLRWDTDSKMHLKLLRKDQPASFLPLVNQDDLLEKLKMSRKSWVPVTNEVKIQFYERIHGETCCGEADDEAGAGCSGTPALTLLSCEADGDGIYSITGGCFPYYLYRKSEDGGWVKLFKVEKTFGYSCGSSECLDEDISNTIKIVDGGDVSSNEVTINQTAPSAITVSDDSVSCGGSVSITWTGGVYPFKVSLSGTGLWLDSSYSVTEEVINAPSSKSVTVYAEDDSCSGSGTVTVEDNCGTTGSGTVTVSNTALSIDEDTTPETIDPDNSWITIGVEGGCGTFSWSISGSGYALESSTTTSRTNRLKCNTGTCGVNYSATVTFTVLDSCLETVSKTIRNTGGVWSLICSSTAFGYPACGINNCDPGNPPGGNDQSFIVGKYKYRYTNDTCDALEDDTCSGGWGSCDAYSPPYSANYDWGACVCGEDSGQYRLYDIDVYEWVCV